MSEEIRGKEMGSVSQWTRTPIDSGYAEKNDKFSSE